VELIVLNIGLDANIINVNVFTIMVVMALVTTFMTSPVVLYLYPPRLRRLSRHSSETMEMSLKSPEAGIPSENFRALVCVPGEDVLPNLVNLAGLWCHPIQIERNGKVLLHILRLLKLTERESSILSATRESMKESHAASSGAPSPWQQFTKLEGTEIIHDSIVASPTEFPRDIIEVAHENNLNILFYPWQKDDEQDDDDNNIINGLFLSSPCTVCIFIGAASLGQGTGHGKILVPFFGGQHDREAVSLGLSFAAQSPVVIAKFKSSTTVPEDGSSDVVHQHAFSSVEDDDFLEVIKKVSDEENSNVQIVNRKFKSPVDALKVLQDDLDLNYSLIICGRNLLDGFETTTNDWSKTFGTLAGEILERNVPSNLLVVFKSKRSPKYAAGLPNPHTLTESS